MLTYCSRPAGTRVWETLFWTALLETTWGVRTSGIPDVVKAAVGGVFLSLAAESVVTSPYFQRIVEDRTIMPAPLPRSWKRMASSAALLGAFFTGTYLIQDAIMASGGSDKGVQNPKFFEAMAAEIVTGVTGFFSSVAINWFGFPGCRR